jgi:hypothetical protein
MTGLALDPALQGVLRGSLALLFALAALHKLRAPAAFRARLADYRMLPRRALAPVAVGLATAELATSALLCAPGFGALGARFAALLLALYTAAIAANLLRGLRGIDCGCGPVARPLEPALLIRNALLLLCALLAALPTAPRPLVSVDLASIGMGIAAAACLFAAAEGLSGAAARARA